MKCPDKSHQSDKQEGQLGQRGNNVGNVTRRRRSGAKHSSSILGGSLPRKFQVLASVAVVGALALGSPATADPQSDKHKIDAEVEDSHEEVLAYNKKVARATKQVLDARGQLPGARENLAKAEATQSSTDAANAAAVKELNQVTGQILAAEEKLSDLEGDIAELRGNVGGFARQAYQMGPFAELEMLLEAKDPSDFTDRLAAIRNVSKANNYALGAMDENRADLSAAEIRLGALQEIATDQQAIATARLEESKEATAGAAAAKDLVDALIDQENAALRVAKRNQKQVKEQYAELAAEQARIQKKIVAAARKLGNNTGIATGSGSGQWQFPVPGAAIGSNAGLRLHPILGYTRCHAGADISAGSGTPIVAVSDGVVLSAGGGGGYGNYTVISHGGNVTSSYAHQSRMAVSAGQSVKRGQVIGYVGSTGLSTGPHLHFEARVAGAPWNPRGWFGTGPKEPVCV
jgi:murein DD-endopeptidase MepM/ murein hydrolase activator NlpD